MDFLKIVLTILLVALVKSAIYGCCQIYYISSIRTGCWPYNASHFCWAACHNSFACLERGVYNLREILSTVIGYSSSFN